MTFLSRLFDWKALQPREPARDVEALMAPLAAPAIHARGTTAAVTHSYLGGAPVAPADLVWPTVGGRPLSFLAQLDLPGVHDCLPINWLPRTGRLLFFYDVAEQPWGFKPSDAEGWRVIWLDERDAARSGERSAPETLAANLRLPKRPLTFQRIRSYPSYERSAVAQLRLTDGEADALAELELASFEEHPMHQIAGFPRPVQNDSMELEAQLASSGVDCGRPRSLQTPRARMLREAAHEWRLLFQVDSDDAAHVMWGDAGMLYFWVREADARAGRFEGVWLVLQCY